MQNPEPNPVPRPRKDGIVSRAWAEGLVMACGDADHTQRPPGELVAAALKAHHTLSRGFGQSGPVAFVGSDGGVRWLAAFVTEYAALREERDERRRGETE